MNNKNIWKYGLLLFFIPFLGCESSDDSLFELMPGNKTGVKFNNGITPTKEFNILTYEYLYNGGGVGTGDFNKDGLQDIFFAGNMVKNKLYLNQGDLRFRDISKEAGIEAPNRWCTGVTVVDINLDGWDDIYVCASVYLPERRKNLLFINQGPDENGIPVFKEKAKEFGIDDDGFSIHAVFFDYDNDQDLDLYVLTNQVETLSPNKYRIKQNHGESPSNDRIYKNNGDGTFTNATREADIYYEGYGLGISVNDINNDGWKDIYITNDYLTNDVLLINNRDGSFSNQIRKYIKHQCHSAMGHDVADINNDGLLDIFALDMMPEDHQHMIRTMMGSDYNNYVMNKKYGYEHQYMRNVLQLNNGKDIHGNHNFSDIALYAGVFATYWSWTPLFADYDNDGYKDLFISNGFPKDVTDLDYGAIRYNKSMAFDKAELLELIPESRVPNLIFKNKKDLTFEKKNREWGFNHPSFSNGAVYADLDNDGDLDIITSNINEEAFIFRNNLRESTSTGNHYLRIKLNGHHKNPAGYGAKMTLWHGREKQYIEFSPYRGYSSSQEQVIHFGLDTICRVDSLRVIWPDGKESRNYRIEPDQVLEISYTDAESTKIPAGPEKTLYFEDAHNKYGLEYLHLDEVFIDFNIQSTLPHQLTQYGPSLSAGDIDGNGTIDLFAGGSLGYGGTFFLNQGNRFEQKYFTPDDDKQKEDLGTLLFDADGDGDLDLYIVSGSYEQELSERAYQDRLYVNDGRGNFSLASGALPDFTVSGLPVKAADYDGDGDLDLFVGGRVMPGKYPQPVNSYILENRSEKGKLQFVDVTNEVCPDLRSIGMITDALWTDFDNDRIVDLIIVGEWMAPSFFKNEDGKLINVTSRTGLGEMTGWWNSITGADFDNDGDIDYMLGNLGTNSYYKASVDEPVVSYSADFDNNGTYEVVLGSYYAGMDGERRLYPSHSWMDMLKQMLYLRPRMQNYEGYSNVTMEGLFNEEEHEMALKLNAKHLKSSYLENLGNGKFRIRDLPAEAQFAPVFGMLTHDFNEDGLMDVLLVGNDFGSNVFWGRYDALNGLLLINTGNGNFKTVKYRESGFFVPGNGKAIVKLPLNDNQSLVIASQNQDSLKVFEFEHTLRPVKTTTRTARAELYSGKEKKVFEVYCGSSFLSQCPGYLYVPEEYDSLIQYDFSGNIIQ